MEGPSEEPAGASAPLALRARTGYNRDIQPHKAASPRQDCAKLISHRRGKHRAGKRQSATPALHWCRLPPALYNQTEPRPGPPAHQRPPFAGPASACCLLGTKATAFTASLAPPAAPEPRPPAGPGEGCDPAGGPEAAAPVAGLVGLLPASHVRRQAFVVWYVAVVENHVHGFGRGWGCEAGAVHVPEGGGWESSRSASTGKAYANTCCYIQVCKIRIHAMRSMV